MMAIVGLSEFTFGFGFLHEQTVQNWGQLRVAPVLPSLAQEADDAWDARLPLVGTDFYYQFKLSDYLVRRNSLFHKDGTYDEPYYRIAFHRRDNNRQHHRLWQVAQRNANTFYVAPEFESLDEFNTAFLDHRLAIHSRMIPLVDCEDCSDDEQHYITFRQGSRGWIQHSDAKQKTRSYNGKSIGDVYRESSAKWQKIDVKFARAALKRTTDAIKSTFTREEGQNKAAVERVLPLLDDASFRPTPGGILRRTAEVLSVFVGATMVLVGEP